MRDYSDAQFAIVTAGLTVSAPNGGETIAGELGQTTTVTWSMTASPESGLFGVWAVSAAGTWIRLGTVDAVAAQTDYSFAWKQSQAAGAYRVCVTFGPTEGDWTVRDYSDALFTVTSAGLAVTAPNGGETIAGELGQTTDVTWTISAAPASGLFGVWAVSDGGTWTRLGTVQAVENQTEYSFAWKQALAAGNYRVCITYGLTDGDWTVRDYSDSQFSIVTAGLAVTAPNGGETIAGELGQTTDATWTISAAPASGLFGVWAVSDGGTWTRLGTVQAVENQTEYSFAWKQAQAAGNYRICITYGPTDGDWTVRDYSDAPFTVTSAGLAVISPNGDEWLQGEVGQTTAVAWSIDAAPSDGRFGVWAVSETLGVWHRLGSVDAVSGQTDYTFDWTITQPADSYRVCITYGPIEGDWTVRDYSDARFFLESAGLNVFQPWGGEQFQGELGFETQVVWGINVLPESGVFRVWAVPEDGGEAVSLAIVEAVADQHDYELPWTIAQEPGEYRIRVAFGLQDGQWTTSVESGPFTIESAGLEVSAPTAGSTLSGEATVAWTIAAAPESGRFNLVAIASDESETLLDTVEVVPEQTDYEYEWTIDQDPGDYHIRVDYLPEESETASASALTEQFSLVEPLPGSLFVDATAADAQILHLHAGPFFDWQDDGTPWERLASWPVTYTWSSHAEATASGGSYSSADELAAVGQPAASLDLDAAERPQLVFRCYGDSATWVHAEGPAYGMVYVYIDGALWGTVDQYAATATAQASTTLSGLGEAAYHVVRIVPAGAKNASSSGYGITHDAFIAKQSPADEQAESLEDAQNRSTFYTWPTDRNSDASDGAYAFTESQSAATAYTFGGDSVSWLYGVGPHQGKARVLIDGAQVGVVDQYATAASFHDPNDDRQNLIPNPRAHLDTNGWSAWGTVSRVTAIAGTELPSGADAALSAGPRSGGEALRTGHISLPSGVDAGDWLDAQFQAYVGGGVENEDCYLRAWINWYAANGSSIGSSDFVNPDNGYDGYETSLPTSGFRRLTGHGQVPSGAASFSLRVTVGGKSGGSAYPAVLYVTEAQVEPGGSADGEVAAYADGDSDGWSWSGTAHASTSQTIAVDATAVTYGGLGSGEHTIVIESDATKNAASDGYGIVSDAFITNEKADGPTYTEAEVPLVAPTSAIIVSSPAANATLQGEMGASTTIEWTADGTLQGGEFEVAAIAEDETVYEIDSVEAVAGQRDYELAWTISQAAGDYRIRVTYEPGGEAEAITAYGDEFTLASSGLAVVSPNGGESLPGAGGTSNVAWSIASAPSSGSFRVYAVAADGERDLIGVQAVVPAQVTYSVFAWPILQDAGSYRVLVAYLDSGGEQRTSDASDATFTIGEPSLSDAPTVSLSAPAPETVCRLGDTVTATVAVEDLENPEQLASIRLGINRTSTSASRYRGIIAWFASEPNPDDVSPGWTSWQIPSTSNYFAIWDSSGGSTDFGSNHITPDWSASEVSFDTDSAQATFVFRLETDYGDIQENDFDTMIAMDGGGYSWHYPWQNNDTDIMVQPGPLESALAATTTASGWFVESDGNADGWADNLCDTDGQGRGTVGLTWDAVSAADGYAIYLYDGSNYRQVGSSTTTSWTSADKGIYPSDTQITGWSDYASDPFQGGNGLELRDDPSALYAATAGTAFDAHHDYSFCVMPTNSVSGTPAMSAEDPRSSVSLENRSRRLNDTPKHTSYDLGQFAAHAAQAQLDSGALALDVTDLQIASWGPSAALDRHYSSTSTTAGVYAPGWRFGFERCLDEVSATAMAYVGADGERYLFHLLGTSWQAPTGVRATLAADGDEWTLTFTGGNTLRFGEDGVLVSETDRNGNEVGYELNGDELTITAANGQEILVGFATGGSIEHAEYVADSQTRRVDYALGPTPSVTYFDGQAGLEYAISYAYDDDLLTGVSIADWPSSATTTSESFAYDANDALEEVFFADYASADVDRQDARAEIDYGTNAATVTRYGRIGTVNDNAAHTPVLQNYAWNASGTLASASERYVSGETPVLASYRYGPANRLLSTTSASAQTTTYLYDTRGNLVEQTDGQGNSTTYDYDANDRLTSQTDALGATTDYAYDANGNLVSQEADLTTGGERSATLYQYDGEGRLALEQQLISGTVASGVWAESDFDEDGYSTSGQPLTTIYRDVQLAYGATANDLEIERTYDGFGNLLTETAQHLAGNLTPTVTATNTYDTAGRLATSTDANGVVTHYLYDLLGNQVESWKTASGTQIKADWTQTAYDAASRTSSEVSLLSEEGSPPTSQVASTTTHAYDGLGNEITSDESTVGGLPAKTLYDARSNATESWSEGVASYSTEQATRSTFDISGNQLTSYEPGSEHATIDTYYADGNLHTETAPDSSQTSYTYDVLGNELTETGPAADGGQTTTSSSYDLAGRLVEQVDEGQDSTTTYSYDLLGRTLAEQTICAGQTTSSASTYNTLGWTLREQSSDGTIVRNTYDGAGQLTHTSNGDESSSMTYADDGQLLSESDSEREVTYSYDVFGRQVGRQSLNGYLEEDTTTVLDSLGRTTSKTDNKTGTTETYTQPLDEPLSEEEAAETYFYAQCWWLTCSYYHTASGLELGQETPVSEQAAIERRVTERNAAGEETASTLQLPIYDDWYGPTGSSAGSTTAHDGQMLASHATYSESGDLLRQWGAGFAAEAAATDAYNYQPGTGLKLSDDLHLALGGDIERSYLYDRAGHLIQTQDGAATIRDTYDAQGRLTRSRKQTTGGTTTTTYRYLAASAGSARSSDCLRSMTTGKHATLYRYDDHGRRTSQGPSSDPYRIKYAYDAKGRLTHYEDTANDREDVIAYTSQGDLEHVGVYKPWAKECVWAYLSWRDGRLMEQYSAESDAFGLAYFYDGQGRPYAGVMSYGSLDTPDFGIVFSIVTNDAGDVLELLDANGDPFVAYRYDPWGKLTKTTLKATSLVRRAYAKRIARFQLLRWHGYLYDSVSGLYWAEGRWYDPETRQYLTAEQSVSGMASHRSVEDSAVLHYRIRNFHPVVQEKTKWCWAASSVCAIQSLHPEATAKYPPRNGKSSDVRMQYILVNQVFGNTNDQDVNGPMDLLQWQSHMSWNWGTSLDADCWNYIHDTAPTWSKLVLRLRRRQPVLMNVEFKSNGGEHLMVVFEVWERNGKKKVGIMDPWPRSLRCRILNYSAARDNHVWHWKGGYVCRRVGPLRGPTSERPPYTGH